MGKLVKLNKKTNTQPEEKSSGGGVVAVGKKGKLVSTGLGVTAPKTFKTVPVEEYKTQQYAEQQARVAILDKAMEQNRLDTLRKGGFPAEENLDYRVKKSVLKEAADKEREKKTSALGILASAGRSSDSTLPMSNASTASRELQESPAQVRYEKFIQGELEEKKRKQQEENQQWAKEHPVLASAASVASSPLSSVDFLQQLVEVGTIGESLPRGNQAPGELTQTLRAGASEDMGRVGKFLYNTAMSGIDSVVASALSGGIGGVGGTILAGGAASSAMNDIKARGGTDKQAVVGGLVSGIFESLFENFSIGQLNAMKEMPVDSAKTLLKNLVKAAVTNASEEAATETANIIFDSLYMGQLSSYTQAVEQYMSQGMSESEARKAAKKDAMLQIVESAASGALMGVGMGAVGTGFGYLNTRHSQAGRKTAQNAAGGVLGQGDTGKQQAAQNGAGGTETAADGQINAKKEAAGPTSDGRATQMGAVDTVVNSATSEDTNGPIKTGVTAESGITGGPEASYGDRVTQGTENVNERAAGFYDDTGAVDGETARYLDKLGKAAGVPIRMVDASELANGTDGVYVNGEVLLSWDAADPLRAVAKHEVTHRMQEAAPDEYSRFREYVQGIYQEKGSLEEQIRAKQELYSQNGQELSEEQALDELAADYAGELMTDERAIDRIVREDRNLAQRIWDTLREWFSRVKSALGAKSQEARQLEKAQRLWEKALESTYQSGAAAETGGQARYAIYETADGKKYVRADRQVIFGNDPESWSEQLEDYINGKIRRGQDVQLVAEDGDVLTLTKDTAGKVASPYKDGTRMSDETFERKVNAGAHIDELATVSTRGKKITADENARHGEKASGGWNYRTAYFRDFDGKYYKCTISVEISDAGNAVYNIGQMQERSFPTVQKALDGSSANGGALREKTSFADTVSQEKHSVKGARELQKQIDRLTRQNQRLKEQMQLTDIPKANRQAVEKQAGELRSAYSSGISKTELANRLEKLYEGMAAKSSSTWNLETMTAPSWEEIRAEARSIADDILAESKGQVNPLYEEYSNLRKELRGRKISIGEQYRADLESAGGYEGIRKQNFGSFTLSKEGTPIDQVYDELSERYPELFPDDIYHPADQLIRLSEVLYDLRSIKGNPFENDLENTAKYLAGEIEERFYETPQEKPTLADKMERKYHEQRLKDRRENSQRLRSQQEAYEREVNALKEQYREENRQRIENQNASQRRETIRRHAERLGKKLLRPTDKSHVPEGLRGAALHLVRFINTESNFYTDPETGKRVYFKDDPQIGLSGFEQAHTSRTEAARALAMEYAKLAESGEYTVDPDMADYLVEVAELGGKPLGDMTKAELDTVWKVMQIVEHTITEADEAFSFEKGRKISELADWLREDNGRKQDRGNFANPALGAADQLLNLDMLTPETYFHRLGETGEEIYRQMRRAADRQTTILKEGTDRAAKLIEESGVSFKKADREMHTFQVKGGEITLSTSQLMELYALNKREQAMDHIYKGGLKPTGAAKGLKEAGSSKAVQVTPKDVADMLSVLTAEQKKLMDGLQGYLSGDLAKHGNEESMKVYGYEKFKEKNYWPIKVSSTQTNSDPTSEARAKTIPGYGMTKALTPKASNAVELRSAIDTFASHLNQMSTYAAWLGTNEDVTRLYNYKFQTEDLQPDGTVKELFEKVYGKNGGKYLEKLLADVAQGTKAGAERTLLEQWLNKFKSAKVGANLRVILQQPTAILRAADMLDPKYLATGKNPMAGWKKAVKWAPIAQWKDWGYFELDTGRSLRELMAGTEKTIDKVKNGSMYLAGAADSVAWGHLWNAVEAETADTHPELERGSDAFYQAAAERFGEIIDRTQVVDSVLHRTQIMRSSNYGAKISTSFMSEPSKIYNMVVRDLYDLKSGWNDSRTKKEAGKHMARSAASLIVSFAVNAIAQSLPDMWRDDDRDKELEEKFSQAWVENFVENFDPIGYIPYLKDLESIVQGYSVDRTDLEGFADVMNALTQLQKVKEGTSKKTWLSAGLELASRGGDLLGLPVTNIKRDALGIIKTVLQAAGAQEALYDLDKMFYDQENAEGVFYDDLYRAMDTDWDAYKNIYGDMLESGMEEEKIKSGMESRMKEELGVKSVASLPRRWSAPGENEEFDRAMQEAAESGGSWLDDLPGDYLEVAQTIEGMEDGTTIDKIMEIADTAWDETIKEMALENFMGEKQYERYMAARDAGILTQPYAEFLEKVDRETVQRTGKSGSASQDDVIAALDGTSFTKRQKTAIWNSYGWKKESPWG